MSAMRATGIETPAGLRPARISGAGRSGRGLPAPFIEPCPKAKPPPGRPIWPSSAASATLPQYGCSPRWLRCSDQAQVSSVRQPAAARQPADGGRRHAADAFRPFRRGPAGAAQHIVGVGLEAVAAARHEIRVVQALGQQRVRHAQHQGRVGIGSDGHPFGIQRLGRIAARRAHDHRPHAGRARPRQPAGRGWSPAPPDVICVLRSAMPPKAISSRVLPTTLFQSVTRPVTGA